MNENCWLSIIIPHYNIPDSLCRLLDSIGRPEGVQVIVVDDHSKLRQAELAGCRESHPQVLFLRTEPGKKGAGAARNTGLRRAEGEWLLFADADDLFLPGWYDAVSEYRRSDCDLVYFPPAGRNEDGAAPKRHLLYEKLIDDYFSGRYGSEERLRYRFSVPWSKLIRRRVVTDNGIVFDEIPYSNDVMFSAKVGYCARKISADRRRIYCVSERRGSLADHNPPRVYLDRMRVICRRETYLRKRLPRAAMDACWRLNYVFSMTDTLKKGYGIKTIVGLFGLFWEYRMPFFALRGKWCRCGPKGRRKDRGAPEGVDRGDVK